MKYVDSHALYVPLGIKEQNWESPCGKQNLPRLGARCLIELKPAAILNHRPVLDGFRAFGYRMDEDKINLPYWNARLGITVIKRWQYVPGPDF